MYFAVILLLLSSLCGATDFSPKQPSVMVVLLARNKEHALPYFLTLFQQLNYPKHRMFLYIRADHCEDKTISILEDWLQNEAMGYHSLDVRLEKNSSRYEGERARNDLNEASYRGIVKLKEDALEEARYIWADYVLYLDMDVYITEPNIINILLAENKPIISPLLNSLGRFSNFWGEMAADYWYVRSDDYLDLLERKKVGCFDVPMIHSFVLVNLKLQRSDKLTFNPKSLVQTDVPYDDIIAFALSAQNAGLELSVCNRKVYGFLTPPSSENESVRAELIRLQSLKLEILHNEKSLKVSPLLTKYLPTPSKKDKILFDEIYLINLPRRRDRRQKMQQNFDILNLNVTAVDAVDGRQLTDEILDEMKIKFLPGYRDPWHKRLMKMGEIGCFLSHYNVWKDIVEKGHQSVLLFEDDIKFEPYFREVIVDLMHHVESIDLDWDLIYLGRKKLNYTNEDWVYDSDKLVHVDYSYWTLCYIISYEGAKKLLDASPLEKLLPVDEYLPIMFNRHPETEWMEEFPTRDLLAYSIEPLAVYPTHYTGDKGYISDTEDSDLIDDDVISPGNGSLTDKGSLGDCLKGNCPSRNENLPSGSSLNQLNLAKDEL